MSTNTTLYLNDNVLYADDKYTEQVELVEVIFGAGTGGYNPNGNVYSIYSGSDSVKSKVSAFVQSDDDTIKGATLEGLNLPMIFKVDVSGNPSKKVKFTFTNESSESYNTGWDIFKFEMESGTRVDPKLSVSKPD